jgi:heme-binding NEAT domain protein
VARVVHNSRSLVGLAPALCKYLLDVQHWRTIYVDCLHSITNNAYICSYIFNKYFAYFLWYNGNSPADKSPADNSPNDNSPNTIKATTCPTTTRPPTSCPTPKSPNTNLPNTQLAQYYKLAQCYKIHPLSNKTLFTRPKRT